MTNGIVTFTPTTTSTNQQMTQYRDTDLPPIDKDDDEYEENFQRRRRNRVIAIGAAALLVVGAAVGVIVSASTASDEASVSSGQDISITTVAPTSTLLPSEVSNDEVLVGSTGGDSPLTLNDTSVDSAINFTSVTTIQPNVTEVETINGTESLIANTTTTTEPTTTIEPTTTTVEPTTVTPAPVTDAPTTKPPPPPATQAPTPPPATPAPPPPSPPSPPAPAPGKPIDNGSGKWGGSITIVNNLPKVCKYTDKTATWFTGSGRGDLVQGASVTFGPFGGAYTLGVQENVFAKCTYAGTCAWDNKSADNYCYNFSVDSSCRIAWHDCPYPSGNPSPAPDGRKRYTINGEINKDGVCVLTVNPSGNGPFYCDATI